MYIVGCGSVFFLGLKFFHTISVFNFSLFGIHDHNLKQRKKKHNYTYMYCNGCIHTQEEVFKEIRVLKPVDGSVVNGFSDPRSLRTYSKWVLAL